MNAVSVVEGRLTRKKARTIRAIARIVVTGLGVAAAGYAGAAVFTWCRYGSPRQAAGGEVDPLLDRFMPTYEVVERHRVHVRASADITLAAARDQDLLASWISRTVFEIRAMALGSAPDERARPRALLPQVLSLGWGVLAEVPDREVVVGAVTRPWEPNPRFRALSPQHFAAFDEPDYVKIVWSLRADPSGVHESIFRTETRAMATDDVARLKFRRYWALVAPGVALIRRMSLGPLQAEAERRARKQMRSGCFGASGAPDAASRVTSSMVGSESLSLMPKGSFVDHRWSAGT